MNSRKSLEDGQGKPVSGSGDRLRGLFDKRPSARRGFFVSAVKGSAAGADPPEIEPDPIQPDPEIAMEPNIGQGVDPEATGNSGRGRRRPLGDRSRASGATGLHGCPRQGWPT